MKKTQSAAVVIKPTLAERKKTFKESFAAIRKEYGYIWLGALIPAWTAAVLWGKTFNLCELISKLVASVAVIISNYVVSKLFVFKNKKEK